MYYSTYLFDVFFYGCLLVAIADRFGLVTLSEEQSQVFDFLLIFSVFVTLTKIIIQLLQVYGFL